MKYEDAKILFEIADRLGIKTMGELNSVREVSGYSAINKAFISLLTRAWVWQIK